jgi:hypothetical protein
MNIYTIDTKRYLDTLPGESPSRNEIIEIVTNFWSDFLEEVLHLEPEDEDSHPFIDYLAFVAECLEKVSVLDRRMTTGPIIAVDSALADFINASGAFVDSEILSMTSEEKEKIGNDLVKKFQDLRVLLNTHSHLVLPPEI